MQTYPDGRSQVGGFSPVCEPQLSDCSVPPLGGERRRRKVVTKTTEVEAEADIKEEAFPRERTKKARMKGFLFFSVLSLFERCST